MAVSRLDHHRLADSDCGALLRRIGGDDAEGWRAICLLARSFLATLGFSLRLDTFSRDSDRYCRGGSSLLFKIFRGHFARDFGPVLNFSTPPRQLWVCAFFLGP